MNQQSTVKNGLTVKDLVTIRIFSALFLVFALVGGSFFAPNPVLTCYMPVGRAMLCGPVYLLMLAKVRKRWAMALGYLLMGIVADLAAGTGEYKSKKINSLSYILISLGGTASYLVFFANPDGWAKTMLGNGTEQSYIDTMRATGNVWIMIVMLAGTVIAATISAFVGCKMLKKQFEKAGITK